MERDIRESGKFTATVLSQKFINKEPKFLKSQLFLKSNHHL